MMRKLALAAIATLSVSGALYETRICILIENILQSHGAAYSVVFPIILYIMLLPLFLSNAGRGRLLQVLFAAGLSYLASLISLLAVSIISHRLWLSVGSVAANLIAPLVLLSWILGPLILVIYTFIAKERET